jgi:spore germination protein
MVNPVVTLMKTLELPGAFLERTDVLFFAIFMATSLDDAVLYLYLATLGAVKGTKKKCYNLYIFIAVALAYIGAIIPFNPDKVDKLFSYLEYIGLFFIGFIFPLGLVITVIKKRLGRL